MRFAALLVILLLNTFQACRSSEDHVGKNFLFDMGTGPSPVAAYFVQVTPETAYTEDRGFGWLSAPTISFDSCRIKPYDALTEDGVLSAGQVLFRIDAPDGDYFLTVTLGNGSMDTLKVMEVWVNNSTVADQIVTPWYRLPFRTVRRRVTVASGHLDVAVRGDSAGVGLHAIELRPVTALRRIKFQTQLESDTTAVAKAARRLEIRVSQRPEDLAAHNQLDLLKKYLKAAYYYDIGWWSWAVQETGLSIFNRFWAASDALRQILADESDPLYDRAAYLLGKIHYWLYLEQHEEYNCLEAEWFFGLIEDRYPRNRLLRMYLGEQMPHDSQCSPGNEGAPLWASKQREAMCRIMEVIHWWVDNRQVENGEMGGKYGDDVEMLRWWPVAIFGADDPKAQHGFRRLAEGVWNSGLLERGYSKEIEDVEHSAELFSDTNPIMLFMEYGNPTYVERGLISMQNFRDVWTGITPLGHRHFK
ncbi:MAG: hypothetical protein ACETWG_00705, partial [Candidatus Neomarinimicrobiota bacterium]